MKVGLSIDALDIPGKKKAKCVWWQVYNKER
jgi:hypothetical protein